MRGPKAAQLKRAPQPQLEDADKWFVIGMATAVSIVLRRGEDTLAREIWDTLGYDFVPQCVEEFDAKIIRKAIRQWKRK